MTAGYSGRPLLAKLGIKPGRRVRLVDAPDGYDVVLGPLPDGARLVDKGRGRFDIVHVFVRSRRDLDRLDRWGDQITRDGMLWVSWAKKSSPLATDVTGDVVREAGLAIGLVDVKVCAVDEDWSGLKFVRRLKDR